MTETTTSPRVKPEFGLTAPEGVASAWGARAIWPGHDRSRPFIDLVPGRGGRVGPDGPRVGRALDAKAKRPGKSAARSAFDLVRERAERLYKRGHLDQAHAGRETLYEDVGGLVVEGDTLGSHGYLYLVAYFREGTDVDAYFASHKASAQPTGVSLPPPKPPVKLTLTQAWDLDIIAKGDDRYGYGVTKRTRQSFVKKGLIDERGAVTELGEKALAHYREHGVG